MLSRIPYLASRVKRSEGALILSNITLSKIVVGTYATGGICHIAICCDFIVEAEKDSTINIDYTDCMTQVCITTIAWPIILIGKDSLKFTRWIKGT